MPSRTVSRLNALGMKYPNTLHSLQDELFPESGKRKGKAWWKWALPLSLCALFVYRSTRPIMRLSADPPQSFYDNSPAGNQETLQQEKRLANAYWQVAVRRIQKEYSPDKPLPENPPPQFQIAEAAHNMESNADPARLRYWSRLRRIWNQHDAWVVSYGWSTDWLRDTMDSIPEYMPRWVSNIFQTFINLFNDIAQRISYH